MRPNNKPKKSYTKARVCAFAGCWFFLCFTCEAGGIHKTHAEAVRTAHQHMTRAHTPARPITQLRQTRARNWRSQ